MEKPDGLGVGDSRFFPPARWPPRPFTSYSCVVGDTVGQNVRVLTGYSEVMDFSVEQGYRDLRILAGNEEPVCQFKLSHQGVHLLLQKQAVPCAKTVPESDVFM